MQTRSQSLKFPPAVATVPIEPRYRVHRPPPLRRSRRLAAPDIQITEAVDPLPVGSDAPPVPRGMASSQSKIVGKRTTDRGEEEYCLVVWVAAGELKHLSQKIAQYETAP
ncbi:hypothetical protein PISL3812_09957 [Talaromyces islandicus]|uniref:Uncharacterized protein n=1 Tax=Talaromyces islandicus TaxID=28573 RepID=A0A0U1MC29_TALIS|nr:hypothetical protein PISL3812_09957 [Talaromyces islandicus]